LVSVAQPARKENHLMTVISLSLVLGMAVALAIYFAWRLHVVPAQLIGPFNAIALLVCPPFVLSLVFGPATDSELSLGLIVGTIIFANAVLYAGVAAGAYFLFTTVLRKRA
jgi:hypothetical protein